MKFVVQHEGVDCLTVLLNTKIAKHMIGYGLIHKDLKLCLSCIEEMGTDKLTIQSEKTLSVIIILNHYTLPRRKGAQPK